MFAFVASSLFTKCIFPHPFTFFANINITSFALSHNIIALIAYKVNSLHNANFSIISAISLICEISASPNRAIPSFIVSILYVFIMIVIASFNMVIISRVFIFFLMLSNMSSIFCNVFIVFSLLGLYSFSISWYTFEILFSLSLMIFFIIFSTKVLSVSISIWYSIIPSSAPSTKFKSFESVVL